MPEPEPTFAERMVTKLETLLEQSAGLASVNVDGEAVTFADLEARYDYWKGRVALENGARRRSSSIYLGGS
jgi:hypothetical protein